MHLREISQKLLLGHFFISYVSSVCIPRECLTCNDNRTLADTCTICKNITDCVDETIVLPNCTKDFNVSISSNQSGPREGDDITMTCLHNLPGFNLTFEWSKDETELAAQNENRLVLKKVLPHLSGKYMCSVTGICGTYKSSPHDVTVNNNSVILLVICGVAALALVLIMGLIMKYKLKRDNAKHKERMRQRAQAALSSGPTPINSTPQ